MTVSELRKLRQTSAIRLAIVCAPRTGILADSIEALLGGESGFACFRSEHRPAVGFEPLVGNFPDADVVIATLGRFEATAVGLFLASLQRAFPHRPVLVTTTHPDTFDFFGALEMGASDFLLPPMRSSELLPRLVRQAGVTRRSEALVQKVKEELGLRHIIGESPVFLDKVRNIPRFARCEATVLLLGESGTGKEIFARSIHYLSSRASRAFVPINCGALPDNLVESEIFGHRRGAFTGAASDQAGLVREAEGGTLFLDEIDSLMPQTQVKLLRFLQDGEYRAVGSPQILHANVRVIAATNANFDEAVRSGKFREDLFYRLSVLKLTLPPLRERAGDIVLLANEFLEKQAAIRKSRTKILSVAALNRLLSHSWPGNVRELQNVLMRAIVLSDVDTIQASDLDLPEQGVLAEEHSFRAAKSRVVWRFEHDFLTAVLRAHQGNITSAAFAAKKSRRAFWELLRKHKLLASFRPTRNAQ